MLIVNLLPLVRRSLLPPACGGQRRVSHWENLVELDREGASSGGGVVGRMESYVDPPGCKESRVWQ